MRVVVGGKTQGKLHFAMEEFDISIRNGEDEKGWRLLDGNMDDLETLAKAIEKKDALVLDHYEAFVKKQLAEEKKPEQAMQEIMEKHGDELVVICDEVGYGIVPMDQKDREYRECVGRTMCEAAACATEVWRVVAGIGMRIQ